MSAYLSKEQVESQRFEAQVHEGGMKGVGEGLGVAVGGTDVGVLVGVGRVVVGTAVGISVGVREGVGVEDGAVVHNGPTKKGGSRVYA